MAGATATTDATTNATLPPSNRIDNSIDERKLDVIFTHHVTACHPLLEGLRYKGERLRIGLWLEKLCQWSNESSWRDIRTQYIRLLHHMLERNVTEPSFHYRPPDGELPMLPTHMHTFLNNDDGDNDVTTLYTPGEVPPWVLSIIGAAGKGRNADLSCSYGETHNMSHTTKDELRESLALSDLRCSSSEKVIAPSVRLKKVLKKEIVGRQQQQEVENMDQRRGKVQSSKMMYHRTPSSSCTVAQSKEVTSTMATKTVDAHHPEKHSLSITELGEQLRASAMRDEDFLFAYARHDDDTQQQVKALREKVRDLQQSLANANFCNEERTLQLESLRPIIAAEERLAARKHLSVIEEEHANKLLQLASAHATQLSEERARIQVSHDAVLNSMNANTQSQISTLTERASFAERKLQQFEGALEQATNLATAWRDDASDVQKELATCRNKLGEVQKELSISSKRITTMAADAEQDATRIRSQQDELECLGARTAALRIELERDRASTLNAEHEAARLKVCAETAESKIRSEVELRSIAESQLAELTHRNSELNSRVASAARESERWHNEATLAVATSTAAKAEINELRSLLEASKTLNSETTARLECYCHSEEERKLEIAACQNELRMTAEHSVHVVSMLDAEKEMLMKRVNEAEAKLAKLTEEYSNQINDAHMLLAKEEFIAKTEELMQRNEFLRLHQERKEIEYHAAIAHATSREQDLNSTLATTEATFKRELSAADERFKVAELAWQRKYLQLNSALDEAKQAKSNAIDSIDRMKRNANDELDRHRIEIATIRDAHRVDMDACDMRFKQIEAQHKHIVHDLTTRTERAEAAVTNADISMHERDRIYKRKKAGIKEDAQREMTALESRVREAEVARDVAVREGQRIIAEAETVTRCLDEVTNQLKVKEEEVMSGERVRASLESAVVALRQQVKLLEEVRDDAS